MASEPAAKTQASDPHARPASTAEPVDFQHLARYTLGEPELEREVLELFCSQSVLYLEQLRAAMSESDWKHAAHSLKGSARAIGAWRAAQAAERAEALYGEAVQDEGLAQFRQARIDEIEASLREAEAFIASVLDSR